VPVEIVYWDSDCFLALFQEENGKVELCAGTLERAEKGEVVIITSTLTLAEVLWLRGGPKLSQDKAEIIRKFFRRSYIRLRNVTRVTAENAQDLVWNNGVKPKDAIHVSTAIEAKAHTLETFDDGLLKKSRTLADPAKASEAAMSKRKSKYEDKAQSEAFIKAARKSGADQRRSPADKLLGRLSKMPHVSRKSKTRVPSAT
jgi:predicted nucleic acid-binding protein